MSEHRRQRSAQVRRRLVALWNLPEKLAYRARVVRIPEDCQPHFIVAGPPKCGTVWLVNQLARHPAVFYARSWLHGRGEVRYFSDRFEHRVSQYTAVFRGHPDAIRFEKSPDYAGLPRQRLEFMRTVLPTTRFVVVLRDPVKRAFSHAKMDLVGPGMTLEDVPWERFERNYRRTARKYDYRRLHQRWSDIFGDDCRFVDFAEIAGRPAALLDALGQWVGLGEVSPYCDADALTTKVNATVKLPMPARHREFLTELHRDNTEFYQGLARVAGYLDVD